VEICALPAEATLELELSGDGAEETALEKEELRVPRRVAPGAGKGLAVISARREPGGERDRVIVEVAAPKDAPLDLFVEGPTPDWSLPLPEPSGTDGELRGSPSISMGCRLAPAPGRNLDLHRSLRR